MSVRAWVSLAVAGVAGWLAGWAVAAAFRGGAAPGRGPAEPAPPSEVDARDAKETWATPDALPLDGRRPSPRTTDPRARALSLAPPVFEQSLDELAKLPYWNPKGQTLDDRTRAELTAWLAERKREWESCRDRWTGESYRACEEALADGRVLRVCVLPASTRFVFPPFPKIHPSQAEQNKVLLTTLVQTLVTPEDDPGLAGLKEAADALLLEAHDRVKATFGGGD